MSKNIDIPDGWEVKKLGEVGSFFKGKGIRKDELCNSGLSCIIYGQIYTSYEYYTTKFISYIPDNLKNNTTEIYQNDILFAGSGETKEEIGKCIAYIGQDVAYAGGDIIILRQNKLISTYVTYYLNSIGRKQLNRLGQGDSVVHIYKSTLENVTIFVPPLAEQKKIAEILSLWDNAIQQTKELITYKEKYKKGLMQKLLTGKKRLDGFTDEWKTYKLGEVAKMNSGGTPTTSKKEYYNGNINWASITDITSHYKYIYKTKIKITELGIKNSSAKIFPINTILYAMYASIGECIIAKEEMATSQAILGIRCSFSINYEYLFYLLYNYKNQSKTLAQQGTQANLNKEIVENFMFKIPTSLDEQRAIADILSKADEEIELLNKQLNLYIEQKKGLMQNLLTGKVRV